MATTFLTPHTIISGVNALQEAMPTISKVAHHVLIVTDQIMISLGNVKILCDLLKASGVSYTLFAQVNSEPNSTIISSGVTAFQEHHCDSIIALGGGSPIDAMKAIALMNNEKNTISSFMSMNIDKQLCPMIAIPTTAGTGSEATMFTIITDVDTQVKMLLKGSCLIPDIAVIDPFFSMSAPKGVTSSTGIDALCHAIESYTSRKAQPLSDTFALRAIQRIFNNLVVVYEQPNNEEARIQMSLAATEAGISFNNSSVTIIHGMSRPIGALFHVAHGLSNAMLLETCMKYVAFAATDRFAEIARYCNISSSKDDDEATQAFLNHLSSFLKQLHIPTMKEYGIDEQDYLNAIEKMAQDAMDSGSPTNTIKEINRQDIIHLYQQVYH